MQQHIGFLKQLFVTDVFWSQKRKGCNAIDGISLWPFTLYPIAGGSDMLNLPLDISDASATNLFAERRSIMCSFFESNEVSHGSSDINYRISRQFRCKQGAYIVRPGKSYSCDEASDDAAIAMAADGKNDVDLHDQRKLIISRSLFSLCPYGEGPNTAGLWESIDLMAIPVIISEDWDPPGNTSLWKKACIFFNECDDLEILWRLLRSYSKDKEFIKEK
jgi:hypothetical protein